MNTSRCTILLLGILFSASYCFSQDHKTLEKAHEGQGAWEIVFSGLHFFEPGSEASEEQIWGNELHLTYWFNHHWALGAGYTLKYEEGGELGHELA
ncbi:MAG: hypothetical protein AAGD28_09945, partial [Bacteroidota bacterium]